MLQLGIALLAITFVTFSAHASEPVRKCGKLGAYAESRDGRSVLVRLDNDFSPTGGPAQNEVLIEGPYLLETVKVLLSRPGSKQKVFCATGVRDENERIRATEFRQSAGGNF